MNDDRRKHHNDDDFHKTEKNAPLREQPFDDDDLGSADGGSDEPSISFDRPLPRGNDGE